MDFGTILVAVLVVLAIAFIGVMIFGRSKDESDSWEKRSRSGKSSRGAKRKKTGPKVNWLVGRTGDLEDKSFHIGERTATIGRGLGNFIQIGDEKSSKVHAQLLGSPTGMRVKDMGSANGTRVNDEELESEKPRRLSNGDEIAIGDTVFAYYASGNFRDDSLTAKKNIQASQQKKTQALGAIGGAGGPGDLKEKIAAAVVEADGDYDKVAEQFGLDVDLLKKIVGPSEK